MFKENKTIRYYRIRVSVVWLAVIVVVISFVVCCYRNEIYKVWLQSGGREQISYVGLKSKLTNAEECRLCGSSDDSMMDYYRKFDTLGIICINDWNILEFQTQMHDEFDNEMIQQHGTRSTVGSAEEYEYETNSIVERGIAEIAIKVPKESNPNVLNIKNKLCQNCLDKVLDSLTIDKWKNEKKAPLPMCLVDFQTLEIYSLQELSQKLYINNFYVKTQCDDGKLVVEVVTCQ